MKRILLVAFVLVFAQIAFAQNQKDSVDVLIDTIHVRGYVFDRYDNPLGNVSVSSDKLNVRTTKDGYFELKGIANKSHIFLVSDTLCDIIYDNDSRYIIFHLTTHISKLSVKENNLIIKAHRDKPKLLIKRRAPLVYNYPNYDRGGTYPGGMQKFYTFISDNLKYPEKARINNIEGTVGIDFEITKSGSLDNFKIVKDIGYDCSSAIITILKKSKKWNPGMCNGKPIITRCYIEIPFKLTD